MKNILSACGTILGLIAAIIVVLFLIATLFPLAGAWYDRVEEWIR